MSFSRSELNFLSELATKPVVTFNGRNKKMVERLADAYNFQIIGNMATIADEDTRLRIEAILGY